MGHGYCAGPALGALAQAAEQHGHDMRARIVPQRRGVEYALLGGVEWPAHGFGHFRHPDPLGRVPLDQAYVLGHLEQLLERYPHLGDGASVPSVVQVHDGSVVRGRRGRRAAGPER